MTDLGWPALTVPEADGGIGLGMIEAGILAEELGRVIAPGPLLPTVTQFVPVVRALGLRRSARPFPRRGRGRRDRGHARDRRSNRLVRPGARRPSTIADDGDAVQLAGTKRFVFEGDAVDEIVVVGRAPGTSGDDGLRAVVVPSAATRTTRSTRSTGAVAFVHVDLDGVRVEADRVLDTANAAALAARRDRRGDRGARARDGRHRADDLRRHARLRASSASSSACRSARSRRSSTSSPT